jgi:hypothetical protein
MRGQMPPETSGAVICRACSLAVLRAFQLGSQSWKQSIWRRRIQNLPSSLHPQTSRGGGPRAPPRGASREQRRHMLPTRFFSARLPTRSILTLWHAVKIHRGGKPHARSTNSNTQRRSIYIHPPPPLRCFLFFFFAREANSRLSELPQGYSCFVWTEGEHRRKPKSLLQSLAKIVSFSGVYIFIIRRFRGAPALTRIDALSDLPRVFQVPSRTTGGHQPESPPPEKEKGLPRSLTKKCGSQKFLFSLSQASFGVPWLGSIPRT